MTVNEWLEISQMSGTGNAEVTLTASSYEELVERTATLKVKGASTDALISIKQNAFIPTISISERTFFVSSVGETLTITILSNANWSIDNSVLPEWITINDASGEANVSKTLDIIVSDNIGDLREVTIPIFMTNKPTIILGEVKITQDIFSFEEFGYVELVYETDNDNETIGLFDGAFLRNYLYDHLKDTVSSVVSDIIIEGKQITIDGTDRFLFENSGEHKVYVLFKNNEIKENSFGGYTSRPNSGASYYPAYPFRENANLKRVRIPSNVTSTIDSGLFIGCNRLKEIVIDNKSCFGSYFAQDAVNLEDVRLNFQVSDIPMYAFSGCANLSNNFAIDYLHEKVVSIGIYAFQGCSKISGVNNVLDLSACSLIGEGAFKDCVSIDEVYVYDFTDDALGYHRVSSFCNAGKTLHLTSPCGVSLVGTTFKKAVCHTLINDTYSLFVSTDDGYIVVEEIEFLSEEQQTLNGYTFIKKPYLKKLIFHSQLPPIVLETTFKDIAIGGTLVYPEGADYSQLLSTDAYYLGYYNWNAPIEPDVPTEPEEPDVPTEPEEPFEPEEPNTYFWIKLEDDGDIQGLRTTFEFTYDQINWQSCPTTLSVPANTYVWLRNTSTILNTENTITTIFFTQRGSVGGDLSSMGDMREYNFYKLFMDNIYLVDASELILPLDNVAIYCYAYMFRGCSSLTTAPELPATTLANSCYYNMFRGCSSLTTAPELPATTLANRCYYNMFDGCSSLTTAPSLPATTLAEGCYRSMFDGCTSITTAPELPATTLANSCYYNMFNACTSLVNPPVLPATTLANRCYYSMFASCSSLTTAPELPATELVDYCYMSMFRYCIKLNYVKMLATDFMPDCLLHWLEDVPPTGTFVKNASVQTSEFERGDSGIPNGWTVIDATE